MIWIFIHLHTLNHWSSLSSVPLLPDFTGKHVTPGAANDGADHESRTYRPWIQHMDRYLLILKRSFKKISNPVKPIVFIFVVPFRVVDIFPLPKHPHKMTDLAAYVSGAVTSILGPATCKALGSHVGKMQSKNWKLGYQMAGKVWLQLQLAPNFIENMDTLLTTGLFGLHLVS